MGVWALVITVASFAQSQLFYESEIGDLVVAGVLNQKPALVKGQQLQAMPDEGSYRLQVAPEVVRVDGKTALRYWQRPLSDEDDAVADKHRVEGRLVFTPRREVNGTWFAIGWMIDGVLSEVRMLEVAQVQSRHSVTLTFSFDIDASWADGVLWYSLFDGDKPVVVLEQGAKKEEVAKMRANLIRDDTEAVTGALAQGFRWKDLETMDILLLAMNGKLEWLQAWAETERSWTKKIGPDLLVRAVAGGRLEVVKWLLENEVNPSARNDTDDDVLAIAAEQNQWEMIPLILSHNKNRWRNREESTATLLHATLGGRYDLVELMLAAGVEWPMNHQLRSGVNKAINRGEVEMVKTLLSAGVSFEQEKKSIFSPGHVVESAIVTGQLEIVRLFLDQGLDWEGWAKQGVFPLQTAVTRSSIEMIDTLIAAGADPDVLVRNKQFDLVTVALLEGKLEAADHLLSLGVKPVTMESHAPLLWGQVVGRNRPEVAKRLVELGLRLNVLSERNQRLLNAAMGLKFTPALTEAASQGWTGDMPMMDGWNVAGLMEFYGLEEPVVLRQAKTIMSGPKIVPPPSPVRLARGGQMNYPAGLKGKKVTGNVKMEVLIDEAGQPRYIRTLEATDEVFSLQAMKSLERWRFNPMPAGEAGWRRVSIPLEFNPDPNQVGVVGLDALDRKPVVLVTPKIEIPAEGEASGLAAINLQISKQGGVESVDVVRLTDERWRETLTTGAWQWEFQPGQREEEAVATEMQVLVHYPEMRILSRVGTPINVTPRVTAKDFDATLVSWTYTSLKEESREEGVLALYRVTVKKNGKLGDVECVAISQPVEEDNLARSLKRSQFRAALRGEEKVEQELLVPMIYSPSSGGL